MRLFKRAKKAYYRPTLSPFKVGDQFLLGTGGGKYPLKAIPLACVAWGRLMPDGAHVVVPKSELALSFISQGPYLEEAVRVGLPEEEARKIMFDIETLQMGLKDIYDLL